MQKWINLIETNCNPEREDEYNDWYDNIHVPDILATPGFVRARRFVHKELRDGRGKYMAMYEIETDDIEQTMKVRLAKRNEEVKAGRASSNHPGMNRPVWRDVLWKQILDKKAVK